MITQPKWSTASGPGHPGYPPVGEALQWLMLGRLVILYLLGLVGVVQQVLLSSDGGPGVVVSYSLLCVAFAFNGFAALSSKHAKGWAQPLAHILFDALLISVWIFYSAGRENLYSLLYLVQILYVALVLYQRAALVCAVAAAVGFGVVLSLQPPQGVVLMWTLNVALFLALGFVGGYLSEELHRTSVRTVKLEEQLRQNAKLAAVGQLAAGIAHEIRNPLAGMSASIEMLRSSLPRESVTGENQKLMDIALREIDRLNQLISEFLDYVKPTKLTFEVVDIPHQISEVLFALRHPEKPGFIRSLKGNIPVRADIELKEQYESGLQALTSSQKFRQVLWNLVTNAVQAMDKPGTISVGCRKDSGRWALVWVEDEGLGMDEKTLSHLYEPFFTTKEKGTGLGLATAYKIVEALGGQIRVDSKVGKGTRFEILLPLA